MIVSVQDQGLGIAEEDQAHIFDRFYRVNKAEYKALQGLGLGLISRAKLSRSMVDICGSTVAWDRVAHSILVCR